MRRHGEFKTPGGKLVVADIAVEGGQLTDAAITGDFFLEPEDALADIVAALLGAPAGASEAELAARIERGLRPGAQLLGFDARAVATAVRRAVANDTPRQLAGPEGA